MRRAARWAALAALAAGAVLACATYSERTQWARRSADAGDYQAAVGALNRALGVREAGELPDHWRGNAPLAALERGILLQAQGRYEQSARDLGAADQQLEVLDLSGDAVGRIGRYIYSDSTTLYRATPVEKLALNGFNMLNYLARGDLSGAAVEARRFTVMRSYLLEREPGQVHGAFGSYLAGFAFERLGEPDRALRYYDEALLGRDFESLRAPIARLAARSAYRGERLARFLEPGAGAARDAARAAEILTVVSVGRVPHRVPERMPVGAALGIAGVYVTGDPRLLGYTALKAVSYPRLVPSAARFRSAAVSVDGREVPVDLASDLGGEIRREYERIQPQILGAALSRLIVRAAAAEGARVAGRRAGDGSNALGWLFALLTEGALLAMDQPDTRSWTLLPQRVLVSRTPVSPGAHRVEIRLTGAGEEERAVDVTVPPDGFAVVVWTAPR